MKIEKTNAMRILDQKKVNYQVHSYMGTEAISGVEVAEVLGQNPKQVFKTLVTVSDKNVNFVFVIPVEEQQLIKVNLKTNKTDSVSDKHYKQLCIDEINWCRKNADIIINKANCLYRLCVGDSNYKGKNRCLDFKRLEIACEKYNAKKKCVR